VASIARRPDGTYRPRYRDENGKEHARHFKRKADAQRWLDEVTASVVTGSYVDPQAGRATFDAYYRAWSERQVWAPMTEVQMDLVRRKVTFGAVPMAALRASHLETWVKAMVSDGYAPNTVATRVNAVRAALKSAVRDRVIAIDPSAGLRLPARRRAEHAMEIPTPVQIRVLVERSRPGMQAYLGVCAFAGLRLGEASAVHHQGRGDAGLASARAPALLRLRPDRRWLRRRDCAAGAGAPVAIHHAGHLLAPLALGRGPYPGGGRQPDGSRSWRCCGLSADPGP
jgi:hypothetical protein